MKKTGTVGFFEPCFFLLFGVFHLHRVWALADREAYAGFWLRVLAERGPFYAALSAGLALLCAAGIVCFIRRRQSGERWRWLYVLGGGYVLFDLLAIAAGWDFWRRLLRAMFDTSAWYWTPLWSAFILMGGASFGFGAALLLRRR